MDDLHSQAHAFINGPYIIGEHSHLILRYVDGKLGDDPEAQNLLSRCLQTAQTEAARFEGATSGPARDARYFYQRAAELLKAIQDEMAARLQ